MSKTPYSADFFAARASGSASSASVIVPLVLSLVEVRSVVDVGCGIGAWVAEFLARGVPEAWGIDGDYVDRSQIRISPDRFLPEDISQCVRFDRRVDLVSSLEVAEHLPESRAAGFVAELVSMAPCVLFSAALPGQGGTHHINEQYLSYWIRLFEHHNYTAVDPIRPQILGNPSVDWWYQQNVVLFAAPGHPLLERNFAPARDIVHPCLYHRACSAQPSLREAIMELPGAAMRSSGRVRRAIHMRLGL